MRLDIFKLMGEATDNIVPTNADELRKLKNDVLNDKSSEERIIDNLDSAITCVQIFKNNTSPKIFIGLSNGKIEQYDLKTFKKEAELLNNEDSSAVTKLQVHPRGFLVAGHTNSRISILKIDNPNNVILLERENAVISALEIGFNKDKPMIIAGDSNSLITIWDAERFEWASDLTNAEFKEITTLKGGHTKKVLGIQNSINFPNRVYSCGEDCLINVWEIEKKDPIKRLGKHQFSITTLKVWFSHKLLFSGSANGNIRVWCELELTEKYTLKIHSSSITGIAFSNGNELYSSSSDGSIGVTICYFQGGHNYSHLINLKNKDKKEITDIDTHPELNLVISGNSLGELKSWEINNVSEYSTLKIPNENFLILQTIPNTINQLVAYTSKNRLIIIDYDSGKISHLLNFEDNLKVTSLALNKLNQKAYAGHNDGSIDVINLDKRAFVYKLKGGHINSVDTLCLNTSQKYLFSAGLDNIICVWELTTLNLTKKLEGHFRAITKLVFNSMEKTLFSCSEDKSIKVWSFPQLKLIKSIEAHKDSVLDICFTNDGKIVSAGQDQVVKIFRKDFTLIKELAGHRKAVTSILVDPDQKRLYCCSQLGFCSIWDLNSLINVANFETEERDIPDKIFISEDHKDIIIRSADGTAFVWPNKKMSIRDFFCWNSLTKSFYYLLAQENLTEADYDEFSDSLIDFFRAAQSSKFIWFKIPIVHFLIQLNSQKPLEKFLENHKYNTIVDPLGIALKSLFELRKRKDTKKFKIGELYKNMQKIKNSEFTKENSLTKLLDELEKANSTKKGEITDLDPKKESSKEISDDKIKKTEIEDDRGEEIATPNLKSGDEKLCSEFEKDEKNFEKNYTNSINTILTYLNKQIKNGEPIKINDYTIQQLISMRKPSNILLEFISKYFQSKKSKVNTELKNRMISVVPLEKQDYVRFDRYKSLIKNIPEKIFAYERYITAFRINLTNGDAQSRNFFKILLKLEEKERAHFDGIIFYKMRKMRMVLVLHSILFAIFTLLFSYQVYFKDFKPVLSRLTWIDKIKDPMLLGLNALFLIYEILAAVNDLVDYIKEKTNIFDIFMLISTLILGIINSKEIEDESGIIKALNLATSVSVFVRLAMLIFIFDWARIAMIYFLKVYYEVTALILIIMFYMENNGPTAEQNKYKSLIPEGFPLSLLIIIFNTVVFVVAKLKGGLRMMEQDRGVKLTIIVEMENFFGTIIGLATCKRSKKVAELIDEDDIDEKKYKYYEGLQIMAKQESIFKYKSRIAEFVGKEVQKFDITDGKEFTYSDVKKGKMLVDLELKGLKEGLKNFNKTQSQVFEEVKAMYKELRTVKKIVAQSTTEDSLKGVKEEVFHIDSNKIILFQKKLEKIVIEYGGKTNLLAEKIFPYLMNKSLNENNKFNQIIEKPFEIRLEFEEGKLSGLDKLTNE